jgi:two-component system, NtrC family, response regulator PilR
VVPILIPPLRDRREDIPALIAHFLRKYAKEYGVDRIDLSAPTVRTLLSYDYAGNVRELENIIERCVALGSEEIAMSSLQGELTPNATTSIIGDEVLFGVPAFPAEGVELDHLIAQLERIMFDEALKRTGGKKKDAAALLGITFRQFRYRLSKVEEKGE